MVKSVRFSELRNRLSVVLLAFLFLPIPGLIAQTSTPVKVKISLSNSDKVKYQHYMADKKITDRLSYQSSDLDSSATVDTILIQKALTLGGLNFTFDIVDIPNSERERDMVINGNVVIAGTSQWDFFCDENKDKIYKSDVVVPNGSFEKGIYTTKEKAKTLTIETAKDLASLSCVSSSNWRVDWKTLKGLGFKNLSDAPTRDTMFKMVEAGRADVSVQSFSGNPDLSIAVAGITLYPVRGVKVLLNGTRHYVVSKLNPDGQVVFTALQKGLALMKKDNELNRALIETGFFNTTVKSWKIIQVQ